MSESLKSTLCQHPWIHDSEGQNKIIFNQDGTGELILRREIPIFIAAQIKWTLFPPTSATTSATSPPTSTSTSTTEQAEIEITLTPDRLPWISSTRKPKINDQLLKDEAFLPKRYNIRIERDGGEGEYEYRLVFLDRGPYPAEECWRDLSGAPGRLRFWEWRDFVGGRKEK
ncbi:hypothetical protein GGS20DRAFT_560817 [Poronia punctata]|nr:hypothetical protein GGS20DRAFT_560817 [Poronia punctata]